VISIRFFELACKLALISERVCEIVSPAIQTVFEIFFAVDDPLSQMAIMDFIGILSQQPWTSMFLAASKFLERILHKYSTEGDTYGFITNNLITLGAFVFS
jgi:hypothetical protein